MHGVQRWEQFWLDGSVASYQNWMNDKSGGSWDNWVIVLQASDGKWHISLPKDSRTHVVCQFEKGRFPAPFL